MYVCTEYNNCVLCTNSLFGFRSTVRGVREMVGGRGGGCRMEEVYLETRLRR